MKWIKASERLPEKQKQTVLKHVGSGILYLGNADWNDEGVWLFIQSSDAYRAWTVDDWEANLCNWEWLDESTPIPLTPCVELEKEVERLKGLIENELRPSYIQDQYLMNVDYTTAQNASMIAQQNWNKFKIRFNL